MSRLLKWKPHHRPGEPRVKTLPPSCTHKLLKFDDSLPRLKDLWRYLEGENRLLGKTGQQWGSRIEQRPAAEVIAAAAVNHRLGTGSGTKHAEQTATVLELAAKRLRHDFRRALKQDHVIGSRPLPARRIRPTRRRHIGKSGKRRTGEGRKFFVLFQRDDAAANLRQHRRAVAGGADRIEHMIGGVD